MAANKSRPRSAQEGQRLPALAHHLGNAMLRDRVVQTLQDRMRHQGFREQSWEATRRSALGLAAGSTLGTPCGSVAATRAEEFYHMILVAVFEHERLVDELSQENNKLRAEARAKAGDSSQNCALTPGSQANEVTALATKWQQKAMGLKLDEKSLQENEVTPYNGDSPVASVLPPVSLPPNMIQEAETVAGETSILPVKRKTQFAPMVASSRASGVALAPEKILEDAVADTSRMNTARRMSVQARVLSGRSPLFPSASVLSRTGSNMLFHGHPATHEVSESVSYGWEACSTLLSSSDELCERGSEVASFEPITFELNPNWTGAVLKSSTTHAQLHNGKTAAHLEEEDGVLLDKTLTTALSHQQTLVTPLVTPELQKFQRWRLFWDVAGMALIFYDVIWMPMQVFEPPESALTVFMMWVSVIFWSIDMVACFWRPYVKEGQSVNLFVMTSWHYARTWFPVDCIVVGTDWAVVMMKISSGDSNSDDYKELGQIFRILRFLRMLRLTRVFKCKRILDEMHDRINSEYTSTILDVIKLIILLLIANHFLACIWFFIGDSSKGKPNWLAEGGFRERTFEYTYFTALHWSLTQFTPASMSVQPENVAERMFTIVVIVIALVCFSSFLSSITNSIRQLKDMREDDRRQFWLLRKFLKDSHVTQALGIRIIRYLEHAAASRKKTVQESQIKILDMLSDQLRRELRCATSVPHLILHPLFDHINMVSNVTMHRLAAKAISRTSLACGDPLFFAGEMAAMMFFIKDGELQYLMGDLPQWVDGQAFACEPALWTTWTHVGDMLAMTVCEVLSLDPTVFSDAIHTNPVISYQIREYAVEFLKVLNAQRGQDVNDLFRYYEQAKTVLDNYVFQREHAPKVKLSQNPTPVLRAAALKRVMTRMVQGSVGKTTPKSSSA
mmetsp:Transcript_28101/g.51579  ORF Transcript_28101/g.51579 Transcript_28101/m.51579 type:complete len:904 (-) Transcript_28101:150-2861(-)